MGGRNRSANEVLYRGDSADGVRVPDPTSKLGIVEHVLYLGGSGRATPFTSTTESEAVAEQFARPSGKVWRTTPATAVQAGAKHLSQAQLLQNLKGHGKGRAKHTKAWEVAQASIYVKQWSEHLLDWGAVAAEDISAAVARAFPPRGRR